MFSCFKGSSLRREMAEMKVRREHRLRLRDIRVVSFLGVQREPGGLEELLQRLFRGVLSWLAPIHLRHLPSARQYLFQNRIPLNLRRQTPLRPLLLMLHERLDRRKIRQKLRELCMDLAPNSVGRVLALVARLPDGHDVVRVHLLQGAAELRHNLRKTALQEIPE